MPAPFILDRSERLPRQGPNLGQLLPDGSGTWISLSVALRPPVGLGCGRCRRRANPLGTRYNDLKFLQAPPADASRSGRHRASGRAQAKPSRKLSRLEIVTDLAIPDGSRLPRVDEVSWRLSYCISFSSLITSFADFTVEFKTSSCPVISSCRALSRISTPEY